MGKEIIINDLNWYKGEEFLYFAFGEFNSKAYNIYRTTDGSRFSHSLTPSMKDVTVDINGSDGQYYFGTFYKSKVFDISFAFDGLTEIQLREIKASLSGKELKELFLFENFSECLYRSNGHMIDVNKGIYMAKVTGQPNIKHIPFEAEDGETIYKGEGTVQFTAYWPYSRGKNPQTYDANSTSGIIRCENEGDIPAHFIFTSDGVDSITVGSNTITGTNITYWNSKTGIVKNGENVIEYSGNGIAMLPLGWTNCTTTAGKNGAIEFYNWYY